MELIIYSKPGCHLCEGLQEKLDQVKMVDFTLEVRDITTNDAWFAAYQYEIPVLCVRVGEQEIPLPRLSPRAPVRQLEKMLRQYGSTTAPS